MVARILSGIIGLYMLYTCAFWLVTPDSAAQALKMSLEEGMGGNTQMGDFASFFFTAGVFACIGAFRAEHAWLYASISLLGSAALFRSLSIFTHGSVPFVEAIVFEIIMTVVLVICVYLMKKETA